MTKKVILQKEETAMLEGFIIGMLLWAGPAALVWLVIGPAKLFHRLSGHH